VQRNGPILEVGTAKLARLGPDVMHEPPALDAMLGRFRSADQGRQIGEALLDQSLVAGIGNKWRAEALFEASVSPWIRLREARDQELLNVLSAASGLMKEPRRKNRIYRRAGRPCARCGATIRSRTQGEHARMTYWCPVCQAGTEAAGA
jgi:endonuclease-8